MAPRSARYSIRVAPLRCSEPRAFGDAPASSLVQQLGEEKVCSAQQQILHPASCTQNTLSVHSECGLSARAKCSEKFSRKTLPGLSLAPAPAEGPGAICNTSIYTGVTFCGTPVQEVLDDPQSRNEGRVRFFTFSIKLSNPLHQLASGKEKQSRRLVFHHVFPLQTPPLSFVPKPKFVWLRATAVCSLVDNLLDYTTFIVRLCYRTPHACPKYYHAGSILPTLNLRLLVFPLPRRS